jgi:hypothetical protein
MDTLMLTWQNALMLSFAPNLLISATNYPEAPFFSSFGGRTFSALRFGQCIMASPGETELGSAEEQPNKG